MSTPIWSMRPNLSTMKLRQRTQTTIARRATVARWRSRHRFIESSLFLLHTYKCTRRMPTPSASYYLCRQSSPLHLENVHKCVKEPQVPIAFLLLSDVTAHFFLATSLSGRYLCAYLGLPSSLINQDNDWRLQRCSRSACWIECPCSCCGDFD